LTKERHLLQQNWESLRADIETIIKENKLSPAEFKALGIHDDWKAIEEKIYQSFCKLYHPTKRPIWLWEHFKLDSYAIILEQPYLYLDQLADADESVWFFTNGDSDKFWFFEGNIKTIIKVIGESSCIDELYVASKKYQWLICINHHDDLIATGEIMPDKLRKLQAK
jgi:hypothetical protein